MNTQNSYAPDGKKILPAEMAEATIALGALLRHLPANAVEVDRELGIRIEAATEAGLYRWARAVHGDEDFVDGLRWGFRTRSVHGEVAGVPATVVLFVRSAAVGGAA